MSPRLVGFAICFIAILCFIDVQSSLGQQPAKQRPSPAPAASDSDAIARPFFLEAFKSFQAEDFVIAEALFRKGLELAPNNVNGNYYLAETLRRQQKEEAQKYYERVSKLSPESVEGVKSLARIELIKKEIAAPAFVPSQIASRDDQAREVRAYDAASNLFRRSDFPSAIDAFRAFVKDYPASPLAPNAGYWIGICYANLKDYRNALAEQQDILSRYPQSAKAPDALLAIAAIQVEQGDSGSARNTLEDIIARYPGSEAAGKAHTRLASLRR